jgi:DTW domain-containing protein YfiP
LVKPFTPAVRFVILIHPDETKRSIATGRMTHLCLSNSLLIEGVDFSADPTVNDIIADPTSHAVVLFPARHAVECGSGVFPADKHPVIFILDGTWQHARKMLRLSTNLQRLPAVSLAPRAPSGFRVRKQPRPGCLSTLEAVHHVLDVLNPSSTDCGDRPHDNLLDVFQFMVNQQVTHEAVNGRRIRRSGEKPPAGFQKG